MSPQLALRAADPASLDTPLLIVPIAAGPTLPESLLALDAALGGQAAVAWASTDFTGKRDETVMLYGPGALRRVLLVGMGEAATVDSGALRRAAMIGGKRARTVGVERAALLIPTSDVPPARAAQSLAEGIGFGAWHFAELKRPADPPKPRLASVELIAASIDGELETGLERGRAIAAGQAFARGLQVLPADTCTPVYLAGQAEDMGRRHGFTVTVLDREALEREGMHALLAVAKGSANEPRFIALEFDGAEGPPVVLVGKGVTFDTGGISIKPAQGMEEMKYDMSGAAAVLGTFEMLGQLKPKVRVVGLVPSAENMVSSTAYRPGDVVRSHHGKTIEVLNTDAEGRLLLADALSWARRYEPAAVIDCATLTGAVVLGLGHAASAVMGTDAALIEALRRAGEDSGERLWELPLWDEYRDLIKSDIADVKNTGGRPAGSITAGWFLREFVEGFPWAHLDIAGTAYSDKETALAVKGPMAVPVRLFSEFLLGRS
jgi:leucyl aminopeptidase